MAPRGCVPDTKSHASRSRGTHVPRGKAGRSESADSSRSGHDQTRRCRLLHARALLPIAQLEISARHTEAFPAPAGDADGWTARSNVACADPQESRVHASGG